MDPALVTLALDAATTFQLVMRDLLASAGNRVADADTGALKGIAVVAVNNRWGRWEFSTDKGRTWRRFDSPTASSARLLAADAQTVIRFVPNPGVTGTVADGLTFRAWDMTVGTNTGTANITSTGGSTAFSSATETAAITITA